MWVIWRRLLSQRHPAHLRVRALLTLDALLSAPRTALHWDSKRDADSIIVHPGAGLSVNLLGVIMHGLGQFFWSVGAYFEVAFVARDVRERVLM